MKGFFFGEIITLILFGYYAISQYSSKRKAVKEAYEKGFSDAKAGRKYDDK